MVRYVYIMGNGGFGMDGRWEHPLYGDGSG